MNSSPSSVFPLFDVLVVGAGHAGIEAALAASRLGCSVAVLTHNLDTIGQMSCNPAIGGLAKGHIVREIDAMGGAMGLNTDATAIQFRMLNASKGPSVRAPRAQCDKPANRPWHTPVSGRCGQTARQWRTAGNGSRYFSGLRHPCPQRDYLLRDIHEGIASCGPSTHNRRPNGLRFFQPFRRSCHAGFSGGKA